MGATMDKIAIIGLGLIGGSMGLALKAGKRSDIEISGYDQDSTVGNKAKKIGAIDKSVWNLPNAVKEAKIVIITTPVLSVRQIMEDISPYLLPGTIVTDTGSTKRVIMEWAEEYLPEGVNFVGGHPMAGRESSGINSADGTLFKGSRYVVIPGVKTDQKAVDSIISMIEYIGANPYFMDSQEHDSYVGAVSHLPMMLSKALILATSKSPSWREIAKLASSGYRDISRLASGNPIMHLDIALTNKDSITYWIDRATEELQRIKILIENTEQEDLDKKEQSIDELLDIFMEALQSRESWLYRYEAGEDFDDLGTNPNQPDLPTSSDQIADMLFGGRLRERYQQMFEIQSKRFVDNQKKNRHWSK
jgi:prephenate dehydrogenase